MYNLLLTHIYLHNWENCNKRFRKVSYLCRILGDFYFISKHFVDSPDEIVLFLSLKIIKLLAKLKFLTNIKSKILSNRKLIIQVD